MTDADVRAEIRESLTALAVAWRDGGEPPALTFPLRWMGFVREYGIRCDPPPRLCPGSLYAYVSPPGALVYAIFEDGSEITVDPARCS